MRRLVALVLPLALVATGLTMSASSPARSQEASVVKAGYGEADATWHVGAGAGQYSAKSPDNVVNSVSGGDVDPHGHSIAQKDSYGVQSRLSYRAIVVEDAAGDQVAFVKSDSYLAQDYLLRRAGQILLLEGSEISYDEVFHMASHNHSSPYYMTPSAGVWIFQDAFDIRAFEYHARAMAQAILNAEDALVPAQMGATTVHHNLFKGMIQRKGTSDDNTPRGYPDDFGDLELPVIRFDDVSDPENPVPMATMINWGQHPEGLDGHDLITGDYVASLERFVERETGAPLVFGQGDVGSAEAGPGRPDLVAALGIPTRWSHAGHAQAERGAFLLSRDVIAGWNEIATGTPLVAVSSNFDVAAGNAWVAGPYSHPYPSVANCRTETTVEGNPGATGAPECTRPQEEAPDEQLWEELKAAGVPVPDNYDLPSYAGLEENTRLHLQAFKMGEVIVASCACEAQVDLILNFESRANETQGDFWDGFDWTTRMDCAQNPDTTWTCNKKADEPRPNAVQGPFTVSDYRYQRMLAQIHNPADGWDSAENVPKALSEPGDPTEIFGNFTKEELGPDAGYKLPIGVGHASDYNGYTVSYREYQSWDDYRKSLTSYGPHTADYMVTRMVRLAGTLNGVPSPELELDIQRGLPDEARQLAMSTALGAASMATYDAWRAALPTDLGPVVPTAQPRDIRRFQAATFSWRGGSNAVDNPTVSVEHVVDNEWVPFADQSGEVQTRVEFPNGTDAFSDTYTGGQQWIWTANFETFNAFPAGIGSTPAGEYRFVVDGLIRTSEVGAPAGGQDQSYHLVSDSFSVRRWDGVKVSNPSVGDDGSVSFTADSVYPTTYQSQHFRYLSTAISDGFCKQCSFRPWAAGGNIASAQLTVVHPDGSQEKVPAECTPLGEERPNQPVGYTCTAAPTLIVGDGIVIVPGDVVDSYGETTTGCVGTSGEVECPTQGPTDPPTFPAPQSPSPTPAPGSDTTGGGGQQDPAPSSSATPGTTPRASSSPSNTPAPARGTVTTSIAAGALATDYRKNFTVSGVVTGDAICTTNTVEILKRSFGTDGFVPVGTATVAGDGAWSTTLRSGKSASYAARPIGSDLCDGSMSTSVDVLVRARVIATVRNRCVPSRSVAGSVTPEYPGTVVRLQDKRNGRWVTVESGRLNDRSRFRFDHCSGNRVVWPQQDPSNLRGVGKVLILRRVD